MKLPVVKPRKAIAALLEAGFYIHHKTGSHIVLKREKDNRRVVVPYHVRDMHKGTLRNIISQAGLRVDEFIQLLKQN